MDKNNQNISKIIFFAVFAILFFFGATKYQEYVNENSPEAIYARRRAIERHKKDSIEDYQEKVKDRLFKLKYEVNDVINGINSGYVNNGIFDFHNDMHNYKFHISNVSFEVRQNNIYAVCPGKCIQYYNYDYSDNKTDTNRVLICGYSDVTYKILQEFKELKQKEMNF